jgi:hypothetical protein
VHALNAIEAKDDRREAAHRCGMLVGRVTPFAVNHGYAAVNVLTMGQLRGALKPVKADSHAAIVDPERFGKLLKFIDLYADFAGSRAQPGVSSALKLAPLVFLRPGELGQLYRAIEQLGRGRCGGVKRSPAKPWANQCGFIRADVQH